MMYPKIPIFVLAAAMSTSTLLVADDDNEEPFDEGYLFFELNDTDGDLGIHGKIDGGPWKKMEIEGPDGPNERSLLKVRAKGKLRRQGMTELFFESAEPKFVSDDPEEETLDPEEFFARFPEGEYDIEGRSLDGEELESEVYLSHVIPAAPDNVKLNDTIDAPENCDANLPVVMDATDGVIIEWEAVTQSHRAKHGMGGSDPRDIVLGTDGPIDVRYYEVVVEIDESDFKSTSIIPGDETEWEIPGDFFELADGENSDGEDCSAADVANNECFAEYKFEILVRANVYDGPNPVIIDIDGELDNLPGNKSAIESCFLVPAEAEDE